MDSYERFHTFAAIFASIKAGAILPLRGRFLAKLMREGKSLSRRQELPAEAFWTADELLSLHERLVARNPKTANWLFGMVIITFSYRWLTREHPDPDGYHVSYIGKAVDAYLSPEGGSRNNGGMAFGVEMWDTLYSLVFDPLGFAADDAGFDVAIFWDYGSLHQKPRKAAEEELFKQGLSSLAVWFGHRHTVFWRQSSLPEGSPAAAFRRYGESGWCFFESTMSAVLTGSMKRLDLAKTDLVDPAMQRKAGAYYALSRACKTGREPVVLPSTFHVALRTVKRFTNSADIETVARLYAEFFYAVAPCHDRHVLRHLGWGDAEASQFAQALPHFTSLTSLTLSGNNIGPDGAKHLALACTNLKALARIELDDNKLGNEGALAFVPLVYSSIVLTHLDLTNNGLDARALDALRWARYPLREKRCKHAGLVPTRNLSGGLRLLVETPQVGAYTSETLCGGISVTFEVFEPSVQELFCPVFLVIGEDVSHLAVFEGTCEDGVVQTSNLLITQTSPISLTPGHLPFPGKPYGLGITPPEARYLQFDGVGMIFKRPDGAEFMQPSIDTFLFCAAFKRLVRRRADKPFKRIVEIGSGSAFIAKYASLRANPSGPVPCTAVDIDPKAETWGRTTGFGAAGSGCHVEFITKDGIEWLNDSALVDCILSNPPYIPSESECAPLRNAKGQGFATRLTDYFLDGFKTNLFWDGVGMLVWMIEAFAEGQYGAAEATLVTVVSSLSLKSPQVRTAIAEAADKHGCRVEMLLRREVSWKAFYVGPGKDVEKNAYLMATKEEARTPVTIAGCEMWVGATKDGHPRECYTEDGRRNFKNYFWHVLHILAIHRV